MEIYAQDRDGYIDSSAADVAKALQGRGGAQVVLATTPGGKAFAAAVGGLRRGGVAMSDVGAMVETMPLERAPVAYARMMSGQARFRMVLTMA